MQNLNLILIILFILFSFILHLLGLMKLISVFITGPILFFSLFLFVYYLNNRNRFKGFKN
ncbi:hypothetical protein PB1_02840 [Bacillus methanolicus PB1]|uniref:Uncharacterized protein n=1 Tax=Bacillus methanolicus PB1 TaxID=997296 RepID=I3E5S0_BACMT|nr:hypothetical protein [Bacillus methanolicus]EIJ81841.1 hypothetical protein PB1_02840 [Bacillus methanolicus PB1]